MDPRTTKPDFDILKVDFEWVEKTDKPKELQKALKALKQEGGFEALENAIQAKLESLDPKFKKPTNEASSEEMKKLSEDLEEWMEELKKKEEELSKAETQTKQINMQKAEEEKSKGNDYTRSKEFELAIECYNRAEALDPSNAAIYCNRALAGLKLKRYQKVVDDCNKAIKLDPNYVKAYNRRGKAYIELKEYREALKDFEFIVEKEPENAEANADLKKCRDEVNKTGGFKRIQIVEEEEEENEEQKESDQKNNQEEIKEQPLADKLLDTGSESSQILSRTQELKLQGNEYYTQGKYGKAIDTYLSAANELIDLTKENSSLLANEKAALYNNIAASYMQQGDDDKTIEYSSLALEQSPIDNIAKSKAYLRRGLAYEKKEQILKARADMICVKELDPSNIQASKALQRYAGQMANDKEAEVLKDLQTLEGLIQQIEKLKEAGNLYFKQEKFDEAILEFSTGIEKIEVNISKEAQLKDARVTSLIIQLHNNRALAYLKLDCNKEVIKDCEKVLEVDPGNVKSLYRLAKAEGNTGLFKNAAKHMKMVTEIEPSNLVAKKEFDNLMKSAIEAEKIAKENEEEKEGKKVDESPRHVGFSGVAEEIKTPTEINPREIKMPPAEKKLPKPKATTFSEETISQAKKQAFEQLGSFESPKNSTSFEVTINSFKNNPQQLYEFIHNLSPQNISDLFKNNQMSPEVFSTIIKSINTLTELDSDWISGFLIELLSTSRINTTIKFLSKSEKATIRELVSKASLDEEKTKIIFSSYNL
ncbi:unnamed protein product [Blepharisma stoltei]|uniref:RNA polymerase II-associated protein 3 n=1 Tax=Blepharisma stoltei TaxID=1481888 RepID=A0AAU9IRS5_9CILI|nr:unnamed protein product [Blepharisma stoltei]